MGPSGWNRNRRTLLTPAQMRTIRESDGNLTAGELAESMTGITPKQVSDYARRNSIELKDGRGRPKAKSEDEVRSELLKLQAIWHRRKRS